MKNAKMTIATVEFQCPECDEFISHEDGSHLFPAYSIPEKLECFDCKKEFAVPAAAKKLRKI